MNSQIHILLNTEDHNRIKVEARKENKALTVLCRQRILENQNLARIEQKLDLLLRNISSLTISNRERRTKVQHGSERAGHTYKPKQRK